MAVALSHQVVGATLSVWRVPLLIGCSLFIKQDEVRWVGVSGVVVVPSIADAVAAKTRVVLLLVLPIHVWLIVGDGILLHLPIDDEDVGGAESGA